jgi:hypothetical protein
MKDSQYLQKAFIEACKQAEDWVRVGVPSNDKDHARVAMGVIGSYTRLKAVENNEQMIKVSIARSMANNSDEMKEALKKSLPEYVNN